VSNNRGLFPEDLEKLNGFLESVGGVRPCALCGNSNWQAEGIVTFIVRPKFARSYPFSGPAVPCVILTCGVCGNALFINANRAGLIGSVSTPAEDDAAAAAAAAAAASGEFST
jgi:hypothetical protein